MLKTWTMSQESPNVFFKAIHFYLVLAFIVTTESQSGDFWTAKGIYRLIALLD